MSQKYEKLKALLLELFQLDQPDLDFGIYRIMHAKSAEVTQFLDRELLPQVKAEFAKYTTADKFEIEKELAKAIAQAQALGAEPDALPKVRELKEKLASEAVNVDALEAEVYDHLFGFFRRYYSEGDFLSKRVYKPGVYAIPYEGEEVKLHWANADQYYIKTSEYLRDYAFRLRPDDDSKPMRVHFRLVEAAEGEHGNVKAVEGKDRVFLLAANDFVAEEAGEQGPELVIRFEYRPATLTDWPDDVREGKAKPPAQKDLTALAESRALASSEAVVAPWLAELSKPHIKSGGEQADYNRLRAHLNRYVGRNTFDYFIHKELGNFLRRELDFYIKNEVMHLDDVENETAPRVEQYLSKIKVVRRIAGKIIAFLAQLEDFQKKLWLKRKFVVETQYCITLDRIPEEFLPAIAANDAQRDDWVKLFAINEIKADLSGPGYTVPLSVDFLKSHLHLSMNTAFFPPEWTASVINCLHQIDEDISGTLVHSENLQALQLLSRRYGGVACAAYLDPPYNTDAAPISYKNGYRRSSWAALMHSRLNAVRHILSDQGVLCVTIDDYQFRELSYIVEYEFGAANMAGVVAIRSNPSGRPTPTGLAQSHEYAIFAKASPIAELGKLPRTEQQSRRYRETDDDGAYMWELYRKRGSGSERVDRRTLYYPVYACGATVRIPELRWSEATRDWEVLEQPQSGETVIWPIDENGVERRWRGTWERIQNNPTDFRAGTSPSGEVVLYYKFRPGSDGVVATTCWIDARYSATEYGTGILREMFTQYHLFDFPKSVHAVEDCLRIAGLGEEVDTPQLCIDCFAGSGTTGHAILNLNRKDGGNRQFVLIEAESYFDTTLLPRLRKAAYAPAWTGAKPDGHHNGVSYIWKCLRLESYEDALNNLVPPRRTQAQQSLLDSAEAKGADRLKEQYILRYMLDVETADSPSLLNIQAFTDPTAYRLMFKRPGSDESREVNVDLLETFNWLIGITVRQIAAPQCFTAKFERDSEERLRLKGRLKQDANGPWWFRTVSGTTPEGRKTLVIWRKRPGGETPEGVEQDNLVLDEWFTRQGYSSKDSEFGLIYVNGTNNLDNLRAPDDTWKVRLIEEDFHRLMFATEGV